jgi:sugar (pentulose or hexulose) kinase
MATVLTHASTGICNANAAVSKEAAHTASPGRIAALKFSTIGHSYFPQDLQPQQRQCRQLILWNQWNARSLDLANNLLKGFFASKSSTKSDIS